MPKHPDFVRERSIERYLVTSVNSAGGIALKLSPGGGWPDRLVLWPGGRFDLVELKRPKGGALAAVQAANHRNLQNLGITAPIVLASKHAVDQYIIEKGFLS